MNKMKDKRNIIVVICIILGVYLIGIIWNQFWELLSYWIIICYCVCNFCVVLIDKQKLSKLACMEWWIYVACIYYSIYYETISKKDVEIVFIICSGLVLLEFRVFIEFYKADSLMKQIGTILIYFLISIILLLFFMRIQKNIFMSFKIIVLLTMLGVVRMAEYTNRFWGMIIVTVTYICLIVIDCGLSSNFLMSSEVEVGIKFYDSFKNLYSLPDIEKLNNSGDILEIVVSFLLCRIIDAVLIGKLVNIFTESNIGWFEKRDISKNAISQ